MRKLLFLGIIVGLTSCLKREEYPIRPLIKFESMTLNSPLLPNEETIGVVKFSFTDGDGDLGLRPSDTLGEFALGEPYYYNLVVQYFEKESGTFVQRTDSNIALFSARFDNLTPTGGDKTLEGEMDVDIKVDILSDLDTVRYHMYIVDRALHHSDTIITPVVVKP